MLLATRCAVCEAPGASPCPRCHATLRPPAPEPPPPGLDGLVALLRYEGAARPLVARTKYRNRRLALAWLAAGLAARAAGAGPVDVVTWAPTTRRHRRRRGFDHAELLARAVARHLGVPARPLLRRLDDRPQTGRPAAERRAAGPRLAARGRVAGRRVLLVDDVVTTGATLAAGARALRAAGAAVVPAAAARTPSPGARARDDQA